MPPAFNMRIIEQHQTGNISTTSLLFTGSQHQFRQSPTENTGVAGKTENKVHSSLMEGNASKAGLMDPCLIAIPNTQRAASMSLEPVNGDPSGTSHIAPFLPQYFVSSVSVLDWMIFLPPELPNTPNTNTNGHQSYRCHGNHCGASRQCRCRQMVLCRDQTARCSFGYRIYSCEQGDDFRFCSCWDYHVLAPSDETWRNTDHGLASLHTGLGFNGRVQIIAHGSEYGIQYW